MSQSQTDAIVHENLMGFAFEHIYKRSIHSFPYNLLKYRNNSKFKSFVT